MVYSMGEVIGDGLIKLPFVDAVRRTYPEARISWCAAKGETVYAGPLKGVVAGLIDEVLTTPPTGADLIDFLHGRPFGGRRFDLVIDTQDNLRRSLFAKRAAARFISAAGDFRLSDARPPKDDPDRWPAAVTDRLAKLLSLGPSPAAPFAGVTLADPRAAAGVGCSFALMGDIVVAAESAYFLQAFRRIGLVPDGGSTYLLPRLVGKARAMEMALLGEKIPAARALDWGLINRCVPDAELMPTALALAAELAAGPRSLGLIRRAIWDSLDAGWTEQLQAERAAQKLAGKTDDFIEGVGAFLQKRPAAFKGR